MNQKGLDASIWAPKGDPHTHYIRFSANHDHADDAFPDIAPQATRNVPSTPRDWICSFCRFSNFQWRSVCFRCSVPASKSVLNGDAIDEDQKQIPVTSRPHPTGNVNSDSGNYIPQLKNSSRGLSGSRWNSSNYNGARETHDRSTVYPQAPGARIVADSSAAPSHC